MGDRSSTPIVAARSARFTAVDLQRNGPATAESVARGRSEPNGRGGGSAGEGSPSPRRVLRSGRSGPVRVPACRSGRERNGTGRRRANGDGTALRRRPDGGADRRGLGVRGALPGS